jgi:TatD DNase family protein
MTYFDSHAHYYDSRFEEEAEGGADALLSRLLSESVSHIVNVGTAPDTCRLAVMQAKRYKNMYTALGIHPSDARLVENMDAAIADVYSLIKNADNKCVALGEIGLDYHYPDTDREMQHRFFRAQMELARELDIPVVIHDRDSHEDVMRVIREYRGVRGILHSFSGSAEMARELVSAGYMISFSGTLTFTNARRPKEVAAILPHDSVLIETDAPYLAPHPLRGTLNHSGNLEYTNRTLASILGMEEAECAALTSENAKRIFGI